MRFTTVNPATEEILESFETMASSKVFDITGKCGNAFTEWSKVPLKDRLPVFLNLARILRENKQKWAMHMTLEMGKPISESLIEIEKCAWTAEIYAEKGEEWMKEEIVEADGLCHKVVYQPLGVILSVMPWNFPFWQALRFGIPTLLAGNGSILKHASNVTRCALNIEEAFLKSGFPENLFRTVIADHGTVSEIAASDLIAGISLTGSTAAGSRIGELAGKNIKKVVLELGGSDPFIVMEDADLEKAASGAVIGRFRNTGQSCIASKRFIVREEIAGQFQNMLAEKAAKLVQGNPSDPATEIGPMVNKSALDEIIEQVGDAVSKGAKVLTGGKRREGRGFFFEPTVITDTTPDMKIVREEVFGPVAPIIKVRNDEEAVEVANSTEFGLGGCVWTKDVIRGTAIAERIESGSVFVNSICKSDPRMPFGGIKKSGLGRELSKYGLREFVNIKGINVYIP